MDPTNTTAALNILGAAAADLDSAARVIAGTQYNYTVCAVEAALADEDNRSFDIAADLALDRHSAAHANYHRALAVYTAARELCKALDLSA